mgnify:CR=1 FL=1
MLLNQASARRDDVSLVTCPGVLHACVATPIFWTLNVLSCWHDTVHLCYLTPPGIWSLITESCHAPHRLPLSQKLRILLSHRSVILQSLHQNLKPGKVANFSILKQTQLSVFKGRHTTQGVICLPKSCSGMTTEILASNYSRLGSPFCNYSLPFQSDWIIRLAIYNYALD